MVMAEVGGEYLAGVAADDAQPAGRALHGVGNPYGYGYGVDFGWIWIFFREKLWSGVGNGVKIPKCLQNTYCPYSFLAV